jgi:hypothetical protein
LLVLKVRLESAIDEGAAVVCERNLLPASVA